MNNEDKKCKSGPMIEVQVLILYMASSLAYIVMFSRREVANLVSLFSIHVSKLYKRTKWPM
jgi:hypothetical protein